MKNFYASLKGMGVLGLMVCWGAGFGQSGQWTWIKGDSVGYFGIYSDNYGIKGFTTPTNQPGAREGCAKWRDADGNLWLFGGLTYAGEGGDAKYYSDLWKYTITTNEWTWMAGDSVFNAVGIYGIKGIESATNLPPSRKEAISWTDASGNLWLFGGRRAFFSQYYHLNDLWKYNIGSNEWTWVSGDSTVNMKSNYGVQGISSSLNQPGARMAAIGWADSGGNLWLFGGGMINTFQQQKFNDLWKYNIVSNEWTWMKGDSTDNLWSVYGTRGVTSAATKPGGRLRSTGWTDASGNLWLFGGVGKDATFNAAELNDLWKYTPATNNWTWVNGDSISMQRGIYGIQGTASPLSKPGAREMSSSWIDNTGNFWLFGGYGNATRSIFFDLNDLWKYDVTANEWTWVKGDSIVGQFGIYGIKGNASSINKPGTRWNSTTWPDNTGNLWLFGGYGFANSQSGYLNDVWKYSPASTLPLHLLTFTAKKQGNTNLLTWTTANEINTDRFDIQRSPNGREFSTIGTVKANPAPGGTGQYSYTDNQTGNEPTRNEKQETFFYRLKMFDHDGAFTYSPIRSLTNDHPSFNITVYPNPAKDNLQLQIDLTPTPLQRRRAMQLQVLTQDGKIVLSKQVTLLQGTLSQSLNISQLAAGHYFIKVISLNSPLEGREAREPVMAGFEKIK